jgi:hypothetical protein
VHAQLLKQLHVTFADGFQDIGSYTITGSYAAGSKFAASSGGEPITVSGGVE